MGALTARLADKGLLLFDGAMGTQLLARGLGPGVCPEEWNISRPEAVAGVHADYAAAGSDIMTTNSFGCSPVKLAKYGLDGKTEELGRAAAEVARRAAPESLVAGSIAPTGQFLPPLGSADPAELKQGFIRQISGLMEGGADFILLETFTELSEMELVIAAAREVDASVDIAATLTFNATPRGFHTMMGVSIDKAVETLTGEGVAALGSNCGNGSEQMTALAGELAKASDLPLIIQANAGLPRLDNGVTVYDETPEDMAGWAEKILDAGARLIGGCCGSTPDHIRAISQVVDNRLAG